MSNLGFQVAGSWARLVYASLGYPGHGLTRCSGYGVEGLPDVDLAAHGGEGWAAKSTLLSDGAARSGTER